MQGVQQLHVLAHTAVTGVLPVVERVAPTLIVGVAHIDIGIEIDHAAVLGIPAVLAAEVDVTLPHLGLLAKVCLVFVGVVVQAVGLDEEAVGEHLHVVLEAADSGFAIVGAAVALYDFAFGGAHSSAKGEFCGTVFCIIVQITGAEGILVLVVNLHQVAAEAGQIVIGIIDHVVALEHGFFLHQLHVLVGLHLVETNVPDGRIAEHISAVVQESGGTLDLAVLAMAGALEHPGIFCIQQGQQAVLVPAPPLPLLRVSVGTADQHQKNQGQKQISPSISRSTLHLQTCNRQTTGQS